MNNKSSGFFNSIRIVKKEQVFSKYINISNNTIVIVNQLYY